MEVTVKLFASLRERRFDAEQRSLAEGSTPASVVEELGIPADQVAVVFINSKHAEKDALLKAGDVLALFPPVGGG